MFKIPTFTTLLTHPDYASLVDPLSPASGKESGKMFCEIPVFTCFLFSKAHRA